MWHIHAGDFASERYRIMLIGQLVRELIAPEVGRIVPKDQVCL
jgi:hypothetical protein